jgi:hypothetical protein
MKLLSALVISVSSCAAFAQTTGTINSGTAPVEPSTQVDVPPGGCMPIGLTTSGEIVFPIQCREFIERQRGKVVEQNPAAVQEKPATQQPDVAPVKDEPAIKPFETIPLPKKHVEHAQRERRPTIPYDGDCEHYRSYDPQSGTYTSFDGRRRSCRE